MEERKIFRIGKYLQIFDFDLGSIISARCTCMWDTMEESRYGKLRAWPSKKLCKHLIEAIRRLNIMKGGKKENESIFGEGEVNNSTSN